jgi:hypothetical protein
LLRSLELCKFAAKVTAWQLAVCNSWWTLDSYMLCLRAPNRRAFLLRRTQTCRALKSLRLHYYNSRTIQDCSRSGDDGKDIHLRRMEGCSGAQPGWMAMRPNVVQRQLYLSAVLGCPEKVSMWGSKKPDEPQAAKPEPKNLQANQASRPLRRRWREQPR